MSLQKSSGITLQDIARALTRLAGELEEQSLRIGGQKIMLAEPLFFKTKQKIKDGKVYLTLSLKALTASDPPPPVSSRLEAGRNTEGERPEKAGGKLAGPAPGGKLLKKEITRRWKEFCKQIAAGERPTAIAVKQLTSRCEQYNLHADPVWQKDWEHCCRTVHNCLAAAAAGDFEQAQVLAAEVNRQTKACHKLYK